MYRQTKTQILDLRRGVIDFSKFKIVGEGPFEVQPFVEVEKYEIDGPYMFIYLVSKNPQLDLNSLLVAPLFKTPSSESGLLAYDDLTGELSITGFHLTK